MPSVTHYMDISSRGLRTHGAWVAVGQDRLYAAGSVNWSIPTIESVPSVHATLAETPSSPVEEALWLLVEGGLQGRQAAAAVQVGDWGSDSRGGLLLGPRYTRSEARGPGTPTGLMRSCQGHWARWPGLGAMTQAGLNATCQGEEPAGSRGARSGAGHRA